MTSRKMIPQEIETFFSLLKDQNPHPKGELYYVNVFTLLIAVVLSARATDKGVNKATKPLFQVADTVEKMLALGEEGIRDYIKTIGLYPTKTKNIYALCQKLIQDYKGEVPAERDALIQLPGVGRKTANVVLNIGFQQPTFPVDTHVFRLANRTGLALGKNVSEVEKNLEQCVPEPYRLHAHHWLILHGRYVCKARKPNCGACVVREMCHFSEKNV